MDNLVRVIPLNNYVIKLQFFKKCRLCCVDTQTSSIRTSEYIVYVGVLNEKSTMPNVHRYQAKVNISLKSKIVVHIKPKTNQPVGFHFFFLFHL